MLSSERTSEKSGIFFMNYSISYEKQFEVHVDYTKQQGPIMSKTVLLSVPNPK